ncbi:MAG: translation elongation factor Ts [Flavobacteriales bacterium]
MATVTSNDVRRLRDFTGAGMMDCKKALEEAGNDFDEAVELLRKKGQKVAAKRQEQEASEGLVLAKASEDGKEGVLLTVNCETDFVAKNDEFSSFARDVLKVALEEKPATVEDLKEKNYPESELSISEKLTEIIGKIGEKIEFDTVKRVEAETVVAYEHPGNKIAALVGMNKTGQEALAKELAMQIAAMDPVALNEETVPEDIKERELENGREQARQEGKPDDIIEKIAEGKLKKFYKENTLLQQPFIKDNDKSVAEYLKDNDPELTVTTFERYSLEG